MTPNVKPGDRVRLVAMYDDPDPIRPGSLGTVVSFTDLGTWQQIDVAWDNGRTLMLASPPDVFQIVPDPRGPREEDPREVWDEIEAEYM